MKKYISFGFDYKEGVVCSTVYFRDNGTEIYEIEIDAKYYTDDIASVGITINEPQLLQLIEDKFLDYLEKEEALR